MKRLGLFLLFFLTSLSVYAQDISGSWNGVLKIQGTELRIVFNIVKNENGYSSTMDSPDQGAKAIPVKSTNFDGSTLKLDLPDLGVKYEGTLNEENSFVGTFKQAGLSLPLTLAKKRLEKQEYKRPQNPKEPYPYKSEEIKFKNSEDNIELAGTLTLPKKKGEFAAVILISGSGPQDRNEELFGHKPFHVLSDHLTRNGIAVLRFDDRGVGESTGDFTKATTFDFAKDVEAAIKYLQKRKEIDKSKIGLIGHSEGGVIAPMVASKNSDVNFIVLMAGSALRGDKLLLLQKKKMELQMGYSPQIVEQSQEIFAGAYEIIVKEGVEDETISESLSKYFSAKFGAALPDNQKTAMINQLTSPWMKNFIRLDPAVYLSKVYCPVLAINGSKDLQVPSQENLEIIENIFENSYNTDVEVLELEGLNHLFQECETGATTEYQTIEQTISPTALEEITNWILTQTEL
jgi:pimeloyl-ACP methyl ester carboxylesterase